MQTKKSCPLGCAGCSMDAEPAKSADPAAPHSEELHGGALLLRASCAFAVPPLAAIVGAAVIGGSETRHFLGLLAGLLAGLIVGAVLSRLVRHFGPAAAIKESP